MWFSHLLLSVRTVIQHNSQCKKTALVELETRQCREAPLALSIDVLSGEGAGLRSATLPTSELTESIHPNIQQPHSTILIPCHDIEFWGLGMRPEPSPGTLVGMHRQRNCEASFPSTSSSAH